MVDPGCAQRSFYDVEDSHESSGRDLGLGKTIAQMWVEAKTDEGKCGGGRWRELEKGHDFRRWTFRGAGVTC